MYFDGWPGWTGVYHKFEMKHDYFGVGMATRAVFHSTNALFLGHGRVGLAVQNDIGLRESIATHMDPGYGRGVPFWAFYFSG